MLFADPVQLSGSSCHARLHLFLNFLLALLERFGLLLFLLFFLILFIFAVVAIIIVIIFVIWFWFWVWFRVIFILIILILILFALLFLFLFLLSIFLSRCFSWENRDDVAILIDLLRNGIAFGVDLLWNNVSISVNLWWDYIAIGVKLCWDYITISINDLARFVLPRAWRQDCVSSGVFSRKRITIRISWHENVSEWVLRVDWHTRGVFGVDWISINILW